MTYKMSLDQELVTKGLSLRHLWLYTHKPNNPVCKAFVLFGSHYDLVREAYAREEAKYWAVQVGSVNYTVDAELKYLGQVMVPMESPSLILSATGEY